MCYNLKLFPIRNVSIINLLEKTGTIKFDAQNDLKVSVEHLFKRNGDINTLAQDAIYIKNNILHLNM